MNVTKLKEYLKQASEIQHNAQQEQEAVRDIINTIAEEYDIPKPTISKAIKAMTKGNVHEELEKANQLAEVLENVK